MLNATKHYRTAYDVLLFVASQNIKLLKGQGVAQERSLTQIAAATVI